MANPEDRVQAASVQFIRTVAPQIRVFAVPNGGLRGKAEGARLKWTGVVAGVPDVCLVLPGGRAAFIEFKAPKGSLKAEQIDWRDWLNANRVPYALCRSIDDVREFLRSLEIPTREAEPA